MGIATQDPDLRSRLDVETSARRLERYLLVCREELQDSARLTGHDDVHHLSLDDICTINSEISAHTDVGHVQPATWAIESAQEGRSVCGLEQGFRGPGSWRWCLPL